MAAILTLPPRPAVDFPLRPHKNGQWYKSVWNPRTKKSEQFYFGSWVDDRKGERALKDPQTGWLARKDAIKAGIDNIRVEILGTNVTLGELMGRFLSHKRAKADAGELSLTTLGDYLREVTAFVGFMKPGTPAGKLKPEHFSAYMTHLTEVRQLGRMSRKRIRAYISAFLRFGAKNGWFFMPNTGTDWVAPATDPDAMRQARLRSGLPDHSARIVNGEEVDRLLARANPTFKGMILLGLNCGLGPADLGRLRWSMIDLERRRLLYPRPKTGVVRLGFLWKRTCEALKRVRTLKHNRKAIEKEGDDALVFLTRTGRPFYQESQEHQDINIDGTNVKKLTGVKIYNAVSITFSRMARELGLQGVSFYRLRHTLRSLAKAGRDKEALDLMMGHKDHSIGRVYDHAGIGWKRIKRVARVVYRRLWPKVKPKAGNSPAMRVLRIAGDAQAGDAA